MAQIHKDFRKRIEKALSVKPQEIINVSEALGRILAADVKARYTSPDKDTAAIDGYALRADDVQTTPTILSIAGESTAARPYKGQVYDGSTVKVFSGAPIPIGADTVIPVEGIEEGTNQITITSDVMRQQNICYAGIDFSMNEPVMKAGNVITARDIGLAAAMKVSWLPVVRKPRIAVLSTGDELSMLGDVGDRSRIIASSQMVIMAMITACGGIPVNLGIASDSLDSIEKQIDLATGTDFLVTTGGLSASANDLMTKIFTQNSKKIDEVTVNLNQKERVLFGKKGAIPALALPGNPISTQICSVLFLKPAIERMLNMNQLFYKKNYALLDRDLDINDKKMDYIFARLTEGDDRQLMALPASSYDRMLMSALAQADCLIAVDQANSKTGCEVEISRFACSVISG